MKKSRVRISLWLMPALILAVGCNQAPAPTPGVVVEQGQVPAGHAAATAPADAAASAPGEAASPADKQVYTLNLGPSEGPLPETPEELIALWKELAQFGGLMSMDPQVKEVALALSKFGVEAFEPLFAIVEDPQAAPGDKVSVVVTMQHVVLPGIVERAKTILSPEHDATSRACAAQIIALVQSPESLEILRGLEADSEPRVRLAALLGLSRSGSAEHQDTLVKMYYDEATPKEQRQEIASELARTLDKRFNEVMIDALQDSSLGFLVQSQALVALSEVGDETGRLAIEALIDDPKNQAFIESGQAALKAIESRQTNPGA